MPAEPKKKKSQHPRIYVRKSDWWKVVRKISDTQKAVLAVNTVRNLPDDYELYPTDDVKDVLKSVECVWRENKNEKPKPAEQQPQIVS